MALASNFSVEDLVQEVQNLDAEKVQEMSQFLLTNPLGWSWPQTVGFCVFIFLAQGIMAFLINVGFSPVSEIPIKKKAQKITVKVLEEFETIDNCFIFFNKLVTTMFTYHVYAFAWNSSNVEWNPEALSLANTAGAMVGLYLVYDFFYTLFHKFLHVRGIYKYVHKHHHRQMAPFRGNLDAINVHPLEFVSGEYLHLLCLYVVPTHVYTILLFITFDGIFASLNHTRFNVIIPPSIFAVKAHDTHHHSPNWNFGQYLTFWDRIFGTYKGHWMDLKKQE